jgi:hypothetical protein
MINKSLWFPYLTKTVIPCSILKENSPINPSHIVTIKVNPNDKIIYWSSDKLNNDTCTNAGVTIADIDGIAKLKFKLNKNKSLPHIHYRICNKNLMLGSVKRIDLN